MAEQESSKRNWLGILKKGGIFMTILAVFLFLLWIGLSKYGDWRLNKDVQGLIEAQNKPYLEDTYGGKTPKETLDLFIVAVEKGDFDLASKYFVLSKQGEWKEKLIKGKENNNLEWFLNDLKKENNNLNYFDPTQELGNRQMYTIGDKMSITFIKYPRDIWKIQEI